MNKLKSVESLVKDIYLSLFGLRFDILVKYDNIQEEVYKKYNIQEEPRVYIQLAYWDKDCKTGKETYWKSRKWYLSEFMVDDEVIKTVYLAFEIAVKHEIMENFLVEGKSLFNPHLEYKELLKVTKERIR